jgi:hypothetical protein
MKQAAKHMGVPGPDTEDLKKLDKPFSDDILKIEIFCPQHQNLSVGDVPGLFYSKYDLKPDWCLCLASCAPIAVG